MGCALFAAGAALVRSLAQLQTRHSQAVQLPNGIDSLEKILLGGTSQWIHVRSHDRSKPLLLWVHGGPGFPQMPFARLNADLGRDYLVVQWDMRGTGKSFPAPDGTLRIEQLVSDLHELVGLLLSRFGRSKCLLVAHSFGTIVGALEVARHPESFSAYVGIGQIVDVPRMQQVRYDFAQESAERAGNKQAVSELQRIGRPPHFDLKVCEVMEKWIRHFSGLEHAGVPSSRFVRLALASPEYNWADLLRIPRGFLTSFNALWRETFEQIDLNRQASRIEVPVILYSGKFDRVAPPKLAAEWLEKIDGPPSKTVRTFEHSAHWPFLEEPEKFCAEMRKLAAP